MQRWMQAAMIRGERHGYAMHGLTPCGQVFEGEFNHTTPKAVRVKEAKIKAGLSTKAERKVARLKLAEINAARRAKNDLATERGKPSQAALAKYATLRMVYSSRPVDRA